MNNLWSITRLYKREGVTLLRSGNTVTESIGGRGGTRLCMQVNTSITDIEVFTHISKKSIFIK